MTPGEIDLVRTALGIAAARGEARAAAMAPGAGQHHADQAEAMRSLCAKLHNHLCELADDDILMLDVAGLSQAERDDICARARVVAGVQRRQHGMEGLRQMDIDDDHVWKMLDAWYQLIGRRVAPSAAERDQDFRAMKRHLEAFERDYMRRAATGSLS